ncbi:MAG: CinA family protein [Clostridiales bacterium]|nr:CinA family protein [Clostridiales bacterium]
MKTLTVRTMGANHACVEKVISTLEQCAEKGISHHHVRDYDEDVIQIHYDVNTSTSLVDDIMRYAVEVLEVSLYALDDVTLEEQVVTLLKLRGRRLSVAESFTGGGLARRIVSVSGASEVYFEGLNTYNELSKIRRLGVNPETLKTKGAVSEQTAYEMAVGLLNTSDCDMVIATTGLAGPNSDASGLPVGLCFIAVGSRERIRVYQYNLNGSRKEITEKAINYALYLAYKQLKDMI